MNNIMHNDTLFQNIQFKVFNELNTLLSNNNLNFFFTKGFPLSIRLYNNPFIRKSCDIDIFIQKKDIKKAIYILSKNHYTAEYSLDIIKKIYIIFGQEFSLIKKMPGIDIKIDIHTFHIDRFGNNTSDYFKNIEYIKWQNNKYPVLIIEFEFMYFIDHYFKHYKIRNKYKKDMHTFLKNNNKRKFLYKKLKRNFDKSILNKLNIKYKFKQYIRLLGGTIFSQKCNIIFRHIFIPFKTDIALFKFKDNKVFLYLLFKPFRSVFALCKILY
ncbi:MAG: nucleotidyltransferase family protein [Candidatus Muirbacterium halophilum]|nr:nucleotidyltransferase family protein [Candidatus Muirbacterium halophilum]